MRARSRPFVALGVAVLGCGGGAAPTALAPTPSAPVTPSAPSFVAPSSGYLVQDVDGLFSDRGELVGPWSGKNDIKDVYVIDASKPSFFLLSDDDVARAAVRDGDRFVVRDVVDGAKVVRPIGRVAAIRRGGAKTLTIVDVDGKTLVDGVVVAPPVEGTPDPPLAWPEYWWTPARAELPVAFCHADPAGVADNARCGWIGPTGAWVSGDDHAATTAFLTGWAEGRRGDGPWRWIDPSGRLFAELDGLTFHGPPSDGLALVGRGGGLEVVAGATSRGKVDASVVLEVDGRGCTDPAATCRYRFHDGRAPVWTQAGGAFASGYLGPDGGFAIPPAPCAAKLPSGPFHDGRAFQCRGTEYVLIDDTGRQIAGPYPAWDADPSDPSPNTYPSGLFFSDGLAAVPVTGGWAYVDTSGKTVLPGPYTIARPFRLGMAVVKKDGAVLYIRKDGTRTLDP